MKFGNWQKMVEWIKGLENSFPLFIKIPVEASKREANSELPKQMELSAFLFVMSRIEATLAANLSYKYCLRKDFCQQPYGPHPNPVQHKLQQQVWDRIVVVVFFFCLPFCLDCPGHLVAPYRVSKIQESILLPPPFQSHFAFYSSVLYQVSDSLSLHCCFVWILSLDLDSGFITQFWLSDLAFLPSLTHGSIWPNSFFFFWNLSRSSASWIHEVMSIVTTLRKYPTATAKEEYRKWTLEGNSWVRTITYLLQDEKRNGKYRLSWILELFSLIAVAENNRYSYRKSF